MATQPTNNSAAARALAAQAQRLQQQIDARNQATAAAQQTAFYAGQGRYRTLGADGATRPRSTVTSGGVPVGQAVPANGGLMGGMPSAGEGDGAAIKALSERVAEVAQSAGPQIGTPNPNTAEVAPRYPQDHYYQQGSGALWQWRATFGTTAGEWVAILAPNIISDGPPAEPGADGQGYLDRTATELYVWDAGIETPAWQGPIGGGQIIYGSGDPFTNQVPWVRGAHYLDTALGRSYIAGPPLTGDFDGVDGFWVSTGPYSFDASSRAAADAFYAGDIYQAPDGAFFRLDNDGDWIIQWFCPDCEEEPAPPPGRVCSDEGYSADWPRPGLTRPSGYPRFFYNCI